MRNSWERVAFVVPFHVSSLHRQTQLRLKEKRRLVLGTRLNMQMNMNVFGKVLPLQSVLVDFSVVVVDLAKPKIGFRVNGIVQWSYNDALLPHFSTPV